MCRILHNLWLQCCCRDPFLYRNLVLLAATLQCSWIVEFQVPRLQQGLGIKEGKDLLLGLSYFHSTLLANESRNHLHFYSYRMLEGPLYLTQPPHFTEDNESQMRRNGIFQVTRYDSGRGTAPWAPNSISANSSLVPRHTPSSRTLDEFWSLQYDADLTKLSRPGAGFGRSGQC